MRCLKLAFWAAESGAVADDVVLVALGVAPKAGVVDFEPAEKTGVVLVLTFSWRGWKEEGAVTG